MYAHANVTYIVCLVSIGAMRAADGHTFHVLAIDDSHIEGFGDAEVRQWRSDWTSSCSTPNLRTLTRVDGLKNIGENIKLGTLSTFTPWHSYIQSKCVQTLPARRI
jgi:hypothetical protein